MADADDEDYFVPLEDQRVFGAGIKRKRIAFVPATDDATTTSAIPSTTSPPKTTVADRYLSIVLQVPTDRKLPASNAPSTVTQDNSPTSHLDRTSHGMRYLTSHGWDPDARVGLGANAQGIRYPIKAKPKHDTVGLRERVDADDAAATVKVRKADQQRPRSRERVVMVDAKEVRRREGEAKRRADKLRTLFYSNDEVERYLGAEAG
ncbi:uncharacterized protein AB675_10924 [Cyphellophora attinorum]|uniref:G-patch domain-containing protein n=1 Tax=Cyphellophora attinorum TaxID=1664694 RepID=A0A0N1GY46_9EURO|nr:uncharacterized protein AB675_10924 [Phialophora attinorum]KPI35522.1 hypothetical protein AB675_10924 [Phialophora attinorum]